MSKIVLIDDKPEKRDSLKIRLDEKLGVDNNPFQVEIWDQEQLIDKYQKCIAEEDFDSNADEDVWLRVLQAEDNISLVVVDHDLSALQNVRISESAIANACKLASIPVCTYHRKPSKRLDSQMVRNSVNQSRSFSIEVDISDENKAALDIINIADGFNQLTLMYREYYSEPPASDGPASILSCLLGRPELDSFFTRYASGPTFASDVINQYINEHGNQDNLERKIPFVLGCWLYNYILPFPGIILHDIAAAAYIDLDLNHFRINSNLFEAALYKGPFSKNLNFWWRYNLDNLLQAEQSIDGVEYLDKKGMPGASYSSCVSSGQPHATFYCLVNQAAILLENSKGNLSWVPKGADLCRIETNKYKRLVPMMGL